MRCLCKKSSDLSFLSGKRNKKGANNAPAPGSSDQTTSNAGNQSKNTPLKRGRINDDDNVDLQDNKRVDNKTTPDKSKMAAAAAASGLSEEELSGLTDDEISRMTEDIHLEGAATTYAAVTKKKQIIDPNLVVYFHRTHQKREPCQKADFDKFMDRVLEVIGYDKKIMELANLDWSGYGFGRGVIATCDQPTIGFLKDEAKKFTVTNINGVKTEFRVWTKREFGHRDIFQGFLHGKTYGDKNGIEILRWIFQINGLQAFKPMLILYQRHRQAKGVFLKFEASETELKDALLAKNLVLKAGICKLRLSYKHVEGEPESAEEQPMEQQQESSSTSANVPVAAVSAEKQV